jgi:hypothetical protein
VNVNGNVTTPNQPTPDRFKVFLAGESENVRSVFSHTHPLIALSLSSATFLPENARQFYLMYVGAGNGFWGEEDGVMDGWVWCVGDDDACMMMTMMLFHDDGTTKQIVRLTMRACVRRGNAVMHVYRTSCFSTLPHRKDARFIVFPFFFLHFAFYFNTAFFFLVLFIELCFLGVLECLRGGRRRGNGVVLYMIDHPQPQGQDNLIPVPGLLDLG